jgi:hypothetical protein
MVRIDTTKKQLVKESTIEDADTFSIRTRVYKSSILLINAVSRSLEG